MLCFLRLLFRVANDIVLCYFPEFRAKTEMASSPLPRHFIVKALKNIVGLDDEDRRLYHMGALRFYLDCLKDVSPNSRSFFFFVSPTKQSRPISKNVSSYFLFECVAGACVIRDRMGDSANPKAHSIQRFSLSVNFFKNCFFKSIIVASCWKLNSIFASFYLRDAQFVFIVLGVPFYQLGN